MNSLDLEFLATGSEPYRYPLASGPEGVTLEGRKTAMAGTRDMVNKKGRMPTLLNVTKQRGCLTSGGTVLVPFPGSSPPANQGPRHFPKGDPDSKPRESFPQSDPPQALW